MGYFIDGQRHLKPVTHLLNIKQSRWESLWDYMARFNKEALQVDDLDERMIVAALMAGLAPSKLLFSLSKNPPTRMADLMIKAQQHMNVEDTLSTRRKRDAGFNPQYDRKKRKL